MLHCNDREFYLGPWPFEHFYHPLDKGDGFIKFATGMLPGGLWLKLDDKIRISPAPVRQEWWVKIQQDVGEKQQALQPKQRVIVVQTWVQIVASSTCTPST